MISETVTTKGTPAITSDCWHVVHAKRRRKGQTSGSFERVVVSEHDDRVGCQAAARAFLAALGKNNEVPLAERDEVFARRPNFKSLKATLRRTKTEKTKTEKAKPENTKPGRTKTEKKPKD